MRPVIACTVLMAECLIAACAGPAQASLGGSAGTLAVERRAMNVAEVGTAATAYGAIHMLTRDNGGTIHEYTDAGGNVFAVAWSGPGKPDLRTLLGPYFTTLQQGYRLQQRGLRRGPLALSSGDVVIASAGHMGFYHGVAYIRSLLPAGFDPATIK